MGRVNWSQRDHYERGSSDDDDGPLNVNTAMLNRLVANIQSKPFGADVRSTHLIMLVPGVLGVNESVNLIEECNSRRLLCHLSSLFRFLKHGSIPSECFLNPASVSQHVCCHPYCRNPPCHQRGRQSQWTRASASISTMSKPSTSAARKRLWRAASLTLLGRLSGSAPHILGLNGRQHSPLPSSMLTLPPCGEAIHIALPWSLLGDALHTSDHLSCKLFPVAVLQYYTTPQARHRKYLMTTTIQLYACTWCLYSSAG